jgi:glycosyltransferase involved in cell wall biosynthesis
MKKKILYIVTKGNWGGAQKYVYQMATSLPKEKFDVSVACGQGNALPEKLALSGIKTIKLDVMERGISLKNEWKNFWNLYKIIKSEKPDILHLNSPKAGGLGAVMGRLRGVRKIIYTVHGWTWNENRPLWQKFLIAFFSWLTMMFCHKVIVIAKREEKQAQKMPFIGKNKIILINNGIERIDFKSKEDSRKYLTEKVGINPEKDALWIGTIAELHKNKGLEFSIKSIKKTKPVVSKQENKSRQILYFILGGGEEKENLKKIIEENSLEKNIFLAGFTEDAESYLQAFDVFVLPSLKEGLPYAVLEAGMAGLPCVLSRVGGMPDIVENNTTGILVTPGSQGEITRAIDYLINNQEIAKSYGNSLKEKILKDFSLDEMIKKTADLYGC